MYSHTSLDWTIPERFEGEYGDPRTRDSTQLSYIKAITSLFV